MEEIIRKPRQQRSRDSLEQMMAVGVEILCVEGAGDFSVADLSARSGVSIGSIYQRFGSKEKIYLALQERILETLDEEVDQLFSISLGKPFTHRDAVFRAVQLFCSHVEKHEVVLRSMIRLDTGHDQARLRGEQSCARIGAAFCQFLVSHSDKSEDRDQLRKIDFCFRTIFACTWNRILHQPMAMSLETHSWPKLVEELSALCYSYLEKNPPIGS